MDEPRHFPELNRLSVLAATILLAYALARYVNLPEREVAVRLPGVYLSFPLSVQTVVAVLVAGLAAAGMDWLARDHPGLGSRRTWQHWLLPSLTALVIGLPLSTLANSPQWWIVFTMGGALLMLVFIAEYMVIDAADIRHPHATAALTALSFALFLILAITSRAAELRLYLLVPVVSVPAGLVALRTLFLRLGGRWMLAWAAGIALAIGQVAAGLHYWRIGPLPFGLALLGPAYALTGLAAGYEERDVVRGWYVEPLVMLGLLWGLAIVFA